MYGETPLDTIEYHHSMLSDRVRTTSFLRSIQKVVRPGDVVLDIGTGTGILAYFACMAGAGHVYAIEQGPILDLARQICNQNGYQDRITFMPGWSTQIDLEERVDVLVTETIGNFAFDEGILGWVSDAKERLLTNGGRIIPHSLALMLVPVDDAEIYALIDGLSQDCCSIDVSPARSVAVNRLHLRDIRRSTFLSTPRCLARVELARVDKGDVAGEVSFIASRDGILYGIAGWFEAELAPGICLSNALPNRVPSWKQGILPLDIPLEVRTGNHIHVGVQAEMRQGVCHWWWQVTLQEQQNRRPEQGTVTDEVTDRARRGPWHVQGSTFSTESRATDVLPDPGTKPRRNAAAEIELFALQSMDGATPLTEIAIQLAARFPAAFAGYEESLLHVQGIAANYRA